jgi:hypothetical protein
MVEPPKEAVSGKGARERDWERPVRRPACVRRRNLVPTGENAGVTELTINLIYLC